MKIQKITINNFRSLGEKGNSIKMTEDVIALIGKNESGKSNIISALDGLQFFYLTPAEKIFKSRNKSRSESGNIKIDIDIEVTPKDIESMQVELFKIDSNEIMNFSFFSNEVDHIVMSFNGIFQRIMEADEEYKKLIEKVIPVISSNKTRFQVHSAEFKKVHTSIQYFSNYTTLYTVIDWKWLESLCHQQKGIINNLKTKQDYYISLFKSILPFIFVYKEGTIKNTYTLEELKDKNKIPPHKDTNNLLYKLLKVIKKSPDEFELLLTETNAGKRKTNEKEFAKGLQTFSDEFNNFYKTGTDNLEIEITSVDKKIEFTIATTGKIGSVDLSERSNGLKWYLFFFIALRFLNINKSTLLIIDEPAVHLHIDAQKELLRLFDKFSTNAIQVIYSTHSPSMIDVDNLGRIRAIEKEDDITQINLLQTSKKNSFSSETLSPIIKAMGCSLKHELSPNSKNLNIIVEGISDYYYIQAFLSLFKEIKINPNIIPAGGVENIPNIASILFGWGTNFKVLLDSDDEGKKVYKKLDDRFGAEVAKTLVEYALNGDIESLLSAEAKKLYGAASKSINASKYMKNVMSGEYTPDSETTNNFKTLFINLELLKD